jgi:endonuclease/exonuclease/phosphatase (EEP) superfamily protein YafD
MDWLAVAFHVLGAATLLVILLPMWRTPRWWVRICDFPRFQVALLALAILVVWPLVRWPVSTDWIVLGAVAAAFIWQMSWVWRYLPGAPTEVRQAKEAAGAPAAIALLTTNVLQKNRDDDRLLRIILNAQADVILAVETDEWWCSQLAAALRSRYPHGLQHPLSNGYGLSLYSRLELIRPQVRFVVDEAIPSIRTGVRLRTGAVIDLYCVHPQPPAVHQDSAERDAELVLVGREIRQRGRPAILLGDLNDVAWSPSTMRFTRAGGLLDPRRGRGFFNTYPARMPGLRYPLDYVFSTPHFEVSLMRVLPEFGSDHLPLIAALHLRDDAH